MSLRGQVAARWGVTTKNALWFLTLLWDAGMGEPVVLVHPREPVGELGVSGCGTKWWNTLSHLLDAPGLRLICCDLRGAALAALLGAAEQVPVGPAWHPTPSRLSDGACRAPWLFFSDLVLCHCPGALGGLCPPVIFNSLPEGTE